MDIVLAVGEWVGTGWATECLGVAALSLAVATVVVLGSHPGQPPS